MNKSILLLLCVAAILGGMAGGVAGYALSRGGVDGKHKLDPRDQDEAVLENMIKMHSPKVIQVNGKDLLYLPNTNLSGRSVSVNYKFYTYENGELKSVSQK